MLLAQLLAVATAASSPGLLVMDFAAEGGANDDVAAAASSVVAHEAERLGVFHVTSGETTRAMLGLARQKKLLGCQDCGGTELLDLGLSAQYLVTGKVVKTGNRLTLFLTLLESGSASPLNTLKTEADSAGVLLDQAGPSTVMLLSKALQGRQGQLLVTASEVGASVKVDGTLEGTTPLPAPLVLAAGPHIVAVEKDGYTAARREVQIAPSELTEAFFRPVPSPDTITEYQAKARSTRLLAWSATGVAAIGLGVFALGQGEADGLYGSPATQGTFLFFQGRLLQGKEVENGVDNRARATDLKNQVSTWQAVSIASLAVAGAAAAAGAVLFITGDPPDKYDGLVAPVSSTPAVTLAPSANGVVLSGSF